jgi:hypothetical protein
MKDKKKKAAERNRRQAEYKRNKPRGCGGCRLCCYVYRLGDKPRLQWCKQVSATGCKIHDDPNRPAVCKTFDCLWKHDKSFPEALRPDRCGLILAPAGEYKGYPILQVSDPYDRLDTTQDGKQLLEWARANKMIICARIGSSQVKMMWRHLGLSDEDGLAVMAQKAHSAASHNNELLEQRCFTEMNDASKEN